MRFVNTATFFVSVAVSACALAPESDPSFTVIPAIRSRVKNEIHASATVAGSPVQATVKFRKYQAGDRSDPQFWYGTDGTLPTYVIQSIIVTKDGKTIPIDPSNYANFGDISILPEKLSFIVSAQSYGIRYNGSDGAGSYTADFIFVNDSLDRVVMHPHGG
jgi:hypothetical protein